MIKYLILEIRHVQIKYKKIKIANFDRITLIWVAVNYIPYIIILITKELFVYQTQNY